MTERGGGPTWYSRAAILLVLAAVACEWNSPRNSEATVYQAVASVPAPGLAADVRLHIVRGTALPMDGIPTAGLREYSADIGRELSDALLDSLEKANHAPVTLDEATMGEAAIHLLAPELGDRLRANLRSGWEEIRKVHGRDAEILEVSRPGFNPQGDTAVVHLMHSCGPVMCSSGEYLIFVQAGGGWELVDRFDVWVW